MKERLGEKVFVGVSGGVDSAVSAGLLKKQGYDVVGVFIRTWTPDFIECTWRDERRDAMRVCASLDIPFLECDAEEAYKNKVADYMIEEYKAGRTPNPDVMCNREVKFGVFWDFARKHGVDFIATGHYAQNEKNKLKKGVDNGKDQSYFLWTLTQEDLAHTLFPVGHLEKSEVRKLAKKFGLPTADKKDSQGVCFLGTLDIKEFLAHYIKTEKGDVLDEKGKIIGYHNGAIFFTLGERHGFTITKKTEHDEPYYVVGKDIGKNQIFVETESCFFERSGRAFPIRKAKEIRGPDEKESFGVTNKIEITNTNWIVEIPKKELTAQIRYHGEQLDCQVKITGEKTANIIFNNNVLVAPGQSIVVYDGDTCLGGGIVK